ncbi:MAG: carbohydrate kinase family protein [Phycisphaerales bacterium]
MLVRAGGMGLNCVRAVRACGVPAALLARTGIDGVRDTVVRQAIADVGLLHARSTLLAEARCVTPTCVVMLETPRGDPTLKQRSFLFNPGTNTEIAFADLVRLGERVLPRMRRRFGTILVHFANIGNADDESENPLATARGLHRPIERPHQVAVFHDDIDAWMAEQRKRADVRFSVDFAPTPRLRRLAQGNLLDPFLSSCDYLLPSDGEAFDLVGMRRPGRRDPFREHIEEVARRLLGRWPNLRAVAVKAAEEGACLAIPRAASGEPSAPSVEWENDDDARLSVVRDPTGAGDVWCGAFLATLARDPDGPLRRCARHGNRMARAKLRGYGVEFETLPKWSVVSASR